MKKIINKELEDLQDNINFLHWCFEASKRCINDSADEKEFEEKLNNLRTEIYDLTEDNEKNAETLFIFVISMQIDDELSLIDTNVYINKAIRLKQECVCLKNEIVDLTGITKNDNNNESRGF